MIWEYVNISKVTNEEYHRYFDMMDIEKQNKVERYKNIEDRIRSVTGEMLARKMLSDYCGLPQDEIIFQCGKYGKPVAVNGAEFNISHSDKMVVCAVDDSPVGIDVEKVRPINTGILRRLCTDTDLQYILGNNTTGNIIPENFSDCQLYRFYEVWTAKEAYFKCIGTGINHLKSISMHDLTGNRSKYQIENYIITVIEND